MVNLGTEDDIRKHVDSMGTSNYWLRCERLFRQKRFAHQHATAHHVVCIVCTQYGDWDRNDARISERHKREQHASDIARLYRYTWRKYFQRFHLEGPFPLGSEVHNGGRLGNYLDWDAGTL